MFDVLQLEAKALDKSDPIASFRNQFYIPQHENQDATYFCGHSLGLQPKTAAKYIQEELDAWQTQAVHGHFHSTRPWYAYHEFLNEGAMHLTGAQSQEVVFMNSLTANLHLMMVSFFNPQGKKSKILIEKNAFPSDRYAVASQLNFHDLDVDENLIELRANEEFRAIDNEDILAAIDRYGNELALIMLPGVQYLSGQFFDVPSIVAAAKKHDVIVGLDLAHAIGNLPLQLHDWEVDFAVWCSYKYLNGGPGTVGGCFVHEKHVADESIKRFAGWWGHDKDSRFKMGPDFKPIASAEGWQLSNPPIMALAPLLASLEIFKAADIRKLREKSVCLSQFAIDTLKTSCSEWLDILSPLAASQRGCQLSLRLKHGEVKALASWLEQKGISVDTREPDIMRMAAVPLYNRYSDIVTFARAIHHYFNEVM